MIEFPDEEQARLQGAGVRFDADEYIIPP